MCGIFACFSRCRESPGVWLDNLKCQLDRRGPDYRQRVDFVIKDIGGLPVHATFYSTVLWLQGSLPQPQPLKVGQDDSFLLWNGDVFSKQGAGGSPLSGNCQSDTEELGEKLALCKTDREICKTFSALRGPRAFVYYRSSDNALFYGKDYFGRHSLLKSFNSNTLVLSSVGAKDTTDILKEVPAEGIFKIDLHKLFHPVCLEGKATTLWPWEREMPSKSDNMDESEYQKLSDFNPPSLISPLYLNSNLTKKTRGCQNTTSIESILESDQAFSELANELLEILRQAVETRVRHQPNLCKNCVVRKLEPSGAKGDSLLSTEVDCRGHARVGVLFSGGLDSAVIAALAREALPPEEPLDLINVAFQQSNGSFDVPDRATGRIALEELVHFSGEDLGGNVNFVEVDVTKEELQCAREAVVKDLLSPLQTVLDDSIGCAVWFAARGRGRLWHPNKNSRYANNKIPDLTKPAQECADDTYQSPCRVLLLGMGADEQLGGYSRHRGRYDRDGMEGLLDEIRLEMSRISERNLGRDNRIVSDHGVAGRFPFLDEDVVSFLNGLKLSDKMDLDLPRGVGEKLLLRGAAHKLGYRQTATNAKRAIQFGSRIAKMENRKEKATDIAHRSSN